MHHPKGMNDTHALARLHHASASFSNKNIFLQMKNTRMSSMNSELQKKKKHRERTQIPHTYALNFVFSKGKNIFLLQLISEKTKMFLVSCSNFFLT
jgi:hypothetical protein